MPDMSEIERAAEESGATIGGTGVGDDTGPLPNEHGIVPSGVSSNPPFDNGNPKPDLEYPPDPLQGAPDDPGPEISNDSTGSQMTSDRVLAQTAAAESDREDADSRS